MFAKVKEGIKGGLFIVTFNGQKRYISTIAKGNPIVKMSKLSNSERVSGRGIMTSCVHYGRAKNNNKNGSVRYTWK